MAHGRAVHRTDKGLQAGKSGECLLKDRNSPNYVKYLEKEYPPLHAFEDKSLHILQDRVPVLAAEHQKEDEGQGTAEAFPALQIDICASGLLCREDY